MKKALIIATVPSMIGQFNMSNIHILLKLGYIVHVGCDFSDISVWNENKVNEFKGKLEALDIKCINIDFSRNMLKLKKHYSSYRKVKNLQNENYDIVHCHTPIASAITRIAFRNTVCKMIYTAHGFHFFKGNNGVKNSIFKYIEKKLASYTDILITINKEDYLAAKSFKLRKNGFVKYVPGVGIDLEKIDAITGDKLELCKELNITGDATLILSVGELSKRKNHIVMIQALTQLPENVHYLLCGIGSMQDELMNICEKLKIQNRVHFLGYRTNVIYIMKSCDIFAFPSLQEGLPVALMEAMACGMPCVASKIRGNIDLIINEENGIIVEKNNSYFYVKGISNLKNHEDMMNSVKEKAKKDSEKYSVIQINKIMTTIYGVQYE